MIPGQKVTRQEAGGVANLTGGVIDHEGVHSSRYLLQFLAEKL